jgi:acyl dehydratase
MNREGYPGLFFEEFEVGETLVSPARTITESDVMRFASLSGDYNPLHTDAEFAEETNYGERIAHGLLGLSVVSGLAARLGFADGTALAFRGLEWKFSKPIKLGDTIRAEFEVIRKKKIPRLMGGIVRIAVTVKNQADEVIQQGTWTTIIKSA